MLNSFKRTFWNEELFHLKHCDYLDNSAVRSPEYVCVCIVCRERAQSGTRDLAVCWRQWGRMGHFCLGYGRCRLFPLRFAEIVCEGLRNGDERWCLAGEELSGMRRCDEAFNVLNFWEGTLSAIKQFYFSIAQCSWGVCVYFSLRSQVSTSSQQLLLRKF